MRDSKIKYVIDVETTGLDFRREKVIEIAAVRLEEDKITDTFESLVNPMQRIRGSSTSIHGITEEMILNAPSIEEVLPQVLDFIEDKPIIGHNVIFDYTYLNQASLSLYGREIENSTIDTLQMFKEVFPEEHSHGLEALLNRFGKKSITKHRALADAYGLAEVYPKLLDLFKERFDWQYKQIGNIHYLFERYLRLQSLIQTLQSEMGDIKSVFKIYFDEGGKPIESTNGETLTFTSKLNYQYDIVKLKEILDRQGITDKALKINTGMIEKMINSNSVDQEIKELLMQTRTNISEQSSVVIHKPVVIQKNGKEK